MGRGEDGTCEGVCGELWMHEGAAGNHGQSSTPLIVKQTRQDDTDKSQEVVNEEARGAK